MVEVSITAVIDRIRLRRMVPVDFCPGSRFRS